MAVIASRGSVRAVLLDQDSDVLSQALGKHPGLDAGVGCQWESGMRSLADTRTFAVTFTCCRMGLWLRYGVGAVAQNIHLVKTSSTQTVCAYIGYYLTRVLLRFFFSLKVDGDYWLTLFFKDVATALVFGLKTPTCKFVSLHG